jgi:heptosyltransferase-1
MPRLLIIKTSSLGDVVHNLPIVADIATRHPEVTIDWLVEEAFADIPRLHPGVATVIPVALRRWRRALFSADTWRDIAAFRRRLRAQSYDLVLDTQGLIKSALLAWQARGESHGQDRASARESWAAMFYDRTYFIARGRHAVVRNRELAARAFGYDLPATAPDYGISAPTVLPALDLPTRFAIGLHATSRESKRWPPAHWVALGQELERTGVALLLPWGSLAEEAQAQAIAASLPQARVLPRLAIRELAALMQRAQAVFGVDTGLVHLAAALRRPTVAIYTDTDPALTGVYAPDAAQARNLGGIATVPTVAQVLQAWRELEGR